MLEKISRYRSAIMGLATIWVVLFHWCENFTFAPPLESLARCGYGGVDVFLLLSGFGLYIGYNKYSSVWPFYIKRFSRLYPIYLFIIIVAFVLKHDYSISHMLLASLGIGFYLPVGNLPWYEWYVPTIFCLYLLFPFIYKTIQKSIKYIGVFLLLAFIMIGVLVFLQKGSYQILAISRIPIFLIGVYMGWLYKNQKDLQPTANVKGFLLISVSLLLYFIELDVVSFYDYTILWKNALFWLPFMIIAPGFTLLAGLGLHHLPCANAFFSKIGEVSLEVYLLHMLVIELSKDFISSILCNNLWMNYLFFALFVIVVLSIALLLKYALKPISNGLLKVGSGKIIRQQK